MSSSKNSSKSSSPAKSPKSPAKSVAEKTMAIATALYNHINTNKNPSIASLSAIVGAFLGRAHKLVDPKAPARARTAKEFYADKMRPKVDGVGLEKNKAINDGWKALSDKKKYDDLATADLKRYEAEDAAYKGSKRYAKWVEYSAIVEPLQAQYNAKKAENMALRDGAKGVDPEEPKAPTAKSIYLAEKKAEHSDAKGKWLPGKHEEYTAKWEVISKATEGKPFKLRQKMEDAKMEEYANYLSAYLNYTPSAEFIAKTQAKTTKDEQAKLYKDAPVKPGNAMQVYIKNAVEGIADKNALKLAKAKASEEWKSLSKEDKEKASEARKKLMTAYEHANSEYAESHPDWTNPTALKKAVKADKPKADKPKAKADKPKEVVVEEPVSDEEEEEENEEEDDESEYEPESEVEDEDDE